MTTRTTTRVLSAVIFFSMAAVSQAQSMVPASVSLKPSQSQKFSVQNAGNRVYFWSLSPSVGTISTAGVYQAPATITASSTVRIFAASPGHPVLSATATLLPVVNVSVAPTWISLTNGQSAAFSATVSGVSNPAVTWSTPSVGAMTSAGVYTVPMTLSSQQNVVVTARSVIDPSKSASATIALIPTITVTVNPTSSVLTGGQSTALNGVANGASNGALTWSISPQVGTISNGIYTAPLPVAAAQTVIITATSQASAGRSASAVLSLIPVSIGITPATGSLSSGQSEAITATVSGTDNLAVNWTVTPAVGTFANGVYQAPAVISAAQTITVKATSAADSSKSASSLISLSPAVAITLTPSAASLTSGQSITLNAVVTGSSNTGVSWSMSPSVGTLSNGVYTAPATILSAQTVTVRATSVADFTKSDTATISLAQTISISVTPSTASLTGGQSAILNATVTGSSNSSVTWTMSPSVGTLSNGIYTAPAPIAFAQTVTVRATSSADATKSDTAAISLRPLSITVSPSTASLTRGQSSTLIATVSGSSNTSVNWSMSPPVGTLSNGVYTAPATIASAQTIAVKATSAADASKSDTAVIFLLPTAPSVSVSVSPTTASLSGGQSAALQATVTGSSNASVTWSISPAVGTVSNGVYTAPATIASAQTITVRATSAADATKSATAAISLVPAAPAVSITVTPATASLTTGQSTTISATLHGTSNLGVVWSFAPSVGSLANGVYTAPAVISQQQTVVVAAASSADPTKIAVAVITLVPTTSIAVVPATVSLSAGQTAQFNVSLSGTNNPNVSWSFSPALGTLNGGLYQAPATINTQQIVTVTAASLSDATKTASATITLVPTVGIALTPSSISLTGGQSTQFNASLAGTSTTAVTWTLDPLVGTITNGVYTAPVTINALQTIILTVASIADPSQIATAAITLTTAPSTSVTPTQATLTPSQTQQFTASGLGTSPKWTLSPATGTITTAGLYKAPTTVLAQTTVTVIATNATDATKAASAVVTLKPAASQTPPPTTITLPIEVLGVDGTTVPVSFNVPTGTSLSGAKLWMRIHGLRSQTQASLQLNGGTWLPISAGSVTLLGAATAYGGIGGGFSTIEMTAPASSVTTGTNTLTFRFNGTDGAVSGFRVLEFNVQSSNGTSLMPASAFVYDNPDSWKPPSSASSDITAGQTLWRTMGLTVPTATGHSPIKAHCMDCHAQDGRDLKYFNYSNKSIQVRSVFHGLSAQQGDQIASYIRSLNVPNPGRVWNPPYQPGPGLDSKPTSNWSAGAGIDAVLDTDADMVPYLTPGGSTAGWAADQYLNPREMPISIQLPDWNSWLPVIHPMDAFGSSFTNSTYYTYYAKVRSELVPNSQTAYKNALIALYDWSVAQGKFMVPINTSGNWTATKRTAVYATALWKMVKQWELNQEFGLEGMPQVVYGSKANPRSWYGAQAFSTSPTLQHIPAGPGLANGSSVVEVYLSFIWYHMQLILNDGQGLEQDHSPIDFGYTSGRLKDLATTANNTPLMMLQLEWLVKALQEETLSGFGPEKGQYGWHPVWVSPMVLVHSAWNLLWSGSSPSQRATLSTDYVKAWFAEIQKFTPQQFYTGGTATATDDPAKLDFGTTFGGTMWFMLPRLRYHGVDPNLTYQISAWAAKIWPKGNWSFNNSATCGVDGLTCTSGY